MRTCIPFFIILIISFSNVLGQNKNVLSIIPQPVSIHMESGNFHLSNRTQIIFSKEIDTAFRNLSTELLKQSYPGIFLRQPNTGSSTAIIFSLKKNRDTLIGKEGYSLKVSNEKITLAANTQCGLFYGLQTLLQMIPLRSAETAFSKEISVKIPCVTITDYPRLTWRGFMLDVSRHFFSVSTIKSLIDVMAAYKFNTFHWHLTDDQGWRLAIESLPLLTKVGAWRVPRTGGVFMELQKPLPGEKATEGGYYSQDDVKDMISYAASKFITIIPEIDIPAHSLALIASYPNISCRQLPQYVSPGSPLTEAEDNVLCVANDSTYLIIDRIITEVAKLFPAPYIHIGGDEADKIFWDSCSKCKQLMLDKKLKDGAELQSYFTKKVAAIVTSKGKKIIGWEEIMQGGLAPGAVVTSWTSVDAGIKAAKLQHYVIMAPWDHGMYMDNSRIERSYSFNPVPDSVDAKYILGGEACLWTEEVPNEREMQRMFWPRSLALAEIFWTQPDHKNWESFLQRMESQLPYFDQSHIKYSELVFEPIITYVKDTGNIKKIKLATEIKGLSVYYSFDNSDPDSFYPKYNGILLDIPAGSTMIKAISYRNGKPIGKMVTKTIQSVQQEEQHL